MTSLPREKQNAKLELQGIVSMFVVMLFPLFQMSTSKKPAPWWLPVSDILLFFLAAFLGAAEVALMDKVPRFRIRLLNTIKVIAWAVAIVLPAIFYFTHRR